MNARFRAYHAQEGGAARDPARATTTPCQTIAAAATTLPHMRYVKSIHHEPIAVRA